MAGVPHVAEPDADAWQRFLTSLPPELLALHENPSEDVFEPGDGRRVSVAELFAVLAEQVATTPGGGQRAVREDRGGAALLAGALRHAAFRQARAVLALRQFGLLTEAQPNARACLEQALTVRRLALAADEGQLEPLLEEIAYQAQRRQLQHLEYLEKLDEEAGGAHRALLLAARQYLEANQAPRDNSRPRIQTAKQLFDGVPYGEHLYSVYSRLSEHTHAGLGSAAAYLYPALRTGRTVPAEPSPLPWAETAALLCWSCWAAEDAMLRFLQDSGDLPARHAALLARIGLAPG